MEKEAINKAIALEVGWREVGILDDGKAYGFHPTEATGFRRVPDFTSDLNACHELWRMFLDNGKTDEDLLFNEGRRTDFGDQLLLITQRQIDKNGGSVFYVLPNLTAEQRCEAFLKTIGKWIEEPTTNPNEEGRG